MNFKILGIVICVVAILKIFGCFDFSNQKVEEIPKNDFQIIHKQKLDDIDLTIIKDNYGDQFVIVKDEKGISITKRF